MKKNDLTEIRQLEVKALMAKVMLAKNAVADFVLDKNMHKLKDLKVISKTRKEIAKMLTIANQKKMLESLVTSDKAQVTSNEEKSKNAKSKERKKLNS